MSGHVLAVKVVGSLASEPANESKTATIMAETRPDSSFLGHFSIKETLWQQKPKKNRKWPRNGFYLIQVSEIVQHFAGTPGSRCDRAFSKTLLLEKFNAFLPPPPSSLSPPPPRRRFLFNEDQADRGED